MTAILGWFLHFNTALKAELESLSIKGFVALNSGVFIFLTALEGERFNYCTFFSSCVGSFSSSAKAIFSLGFVLSESQGLAVL